MSVLTRENITAIRKKLTESDGEGAANRYIVSEALLMYGETKRKLKKHPNMNEAVENFVGNFDLSFTQQQIEDFFAPLSLSYGDLTLLAAFLTREALVEFACSDETLGVKALYSIREIDYDSFIRRAFSAEDLLERVDGYKDMSDKTQEVLRRALYNRSKKAFVSERMMCKRIMTRAESENKDFCTLLIGDNRSRWYYPLSLFLFLCLMFICYAFIGLYALILLLPSAALAGQLAATVVSALYKGKPILRMKHNAVRDVPVLVCVTTLLTSGSAKLFEALERYYCVNKDCNCTFLVLADLCESKEAEIRADDAIIGEAVERVKNLDAKYGAFSMYIRKRKKNASGKFSGRERKRGAIEDLVASLYGNTDEFRVITRECKRPDFILTLDSDTRLGVGSVADMLCAAMHPSNRPAFRKGRIVGGFGCFAPRMSATIDSFSKSPFSVITASDSGIDVYENASFSTSDAVYGEGVYCGKGLIDLEMYRSFVSNVLPDGCVLSHDIPEGALLRTLWLSDTVLTDTAMRSYAAYSARAHRWARGDIQNLFILRYIKNTAGRSALLGNAMRVVAPVMSLAGVLTAAILYCFNAMSAENANLLLLFSLLTTLVPPLVALLASPSNVYSLAVLRTFSRVAKTALLDIVRLMWGISSFLDYSCNMASACFKAFFRMAIKSPKRLEWTTSAQSEAKKGGFFAFCGSMIVPAVIGCALFFFAPEGVFRLLGFVWFWFPTIAFIASKPYIRHKKRVDPKKFCDLAKRMYSFFDENVNSSTHFLPPDNVSFAPSVSTAMRTSPTNIGMYLLSLVCAADFGLLDAEKLREKLTSTLNTLEKMRRLHGHLFNWYDLNDLSVIGDEFVSTVDSGNFVACVTAVRSALRIYGITDLDERFKAVSECDFSALYDESKHLFYIGISPDGPTPNHYDLYMSEARIASYYAVADIQVDREHWMKLSRAVIKSDGYAGMASWSGTAFEYLMPSLFLPSPENTVVNESLRFAVREQRKNAVGTVWGISESAYFAFDADMNYRYRAFGVPSLALKSPSEREYVVSPYSSFLCLPFASTAALKNLSRLKKLGVFGKYGYFESYDSSPYRTENGAVVRCYMAHHMGMSLAALTNYCFDDIIVKRFMADPRMGGGCVLLEEKVSGNTPYRSKRQVIVRRRNDTFDRAATKPDHNSPVCALITNGIFTLLASDIGHIRMLSSGVALNDTVFDRYDVSRTINVTVGGNDVITAADSFTHCRDEVSYVSAKASALVRFSLSGACSVISVLSGQENDISLSFNPIFDPLCDFEAHRAYSLLFLTYEQDSENDILFIRRRHRDGTSLYGALAGEKGIGFSPPSRASSAVSATITAKGTRFFFTIGDSRMKVLEAINEARVKSSHDANLTPRTDSELLTSYLYQVGGTQESAFLERKALWEYSLSGDYPLLFLNEPSREKLISSLLFFRSLAVASLRCEMLVCVRNSDAYMRDGENNALSVIELYACNGFLGRNGGISVVCLPSKEKQSFFSNISFNKQPPNLMKVPSLPEIVCTSEKISATEVPENTLFRVFGGYFGENSFTADRSYSHAAVWSFILTGRQFGCLVTQSSLGFTFFADSRNNRISAFMNDSALQHYAERLLLYCDGTIYDAISCALTVRFSPGEAVYTGTVGRSEYRITVNCCEKYPVKLISVAVPEGVSSCYCVRPPDAGRNIYSRQNASVYIPAQGMFCRVVSTAKAEYGISASLQYRFYGTAGAVCASCLTSTVYALCASKTLGGLNAIASSVNSAFVTRERENAVRFAMSMLPKEKLSVRPQVDVMYNVFLPYQTATSRFFARTGFYQSSGAYGFRDQLQDCLALVRLMPSVVRTHIIRCCAHQYAEGDVMHWFIPKNLGVRTKCSDDFMYLPLLVAEYVRTTADYSILDVPVFFLESDKLTQAERCEVPKRSSERASVYIHCLRALSFSLKRGAHGLPLIGSGDWNDGFSALGLKGRGESVLNGAFFMYVINSFMPLLKERSPELAREYAEVHDRLSAAVEACFEKNRYIRAFGDGAEKIGAMGNRECEIDLSVQVFSSLAGCENGSKALDTAYRELYNHKTRIIKLLNPPFENQNIGYISSYPPGVRENGGQYTHAAAQMLLALWRSGKKERAYELLDALNPAIRCDAEGDRRLAYSYGAEPYALCGDVSPDGRGGWSQYTGSAAWYWCAIREIFGLDGSLLFCQ